MNNDKVKQPCLFILCVCVLKPPRVLIVPRGSNEMVWQEWDSGFLGITECETTGGAGQAPHTHTISQELKWTFFFFFKWTIFAGMLIVRSQECLPTQHMWNYTHPYFWRSAILNFLNCYQVCPSFERWPFSYSYQITINYYQIKMVSRSAMSAQIG